MKRILKTGLGIVLIVLGLAALLTPLTPGSWLAIIGLELLGIRLVVQRKILFFLKPRHKAAVNQFFDKAVSRFRRSDKNNPQQPENKQLPQ